MDISKCDGHVCGTMTYLSAVATARVQWVYSRTMIIMETLNRLVNPKQSQRETLDRLRDAGETQRRRTDSETADRLTDTGQTQRR